MGFKLFQRSSAAVDTVTDNKKKVQQKSPSRPRRPTISLWRGKANRPSVSKQATEALGGKYLSKKHASLQSIDTEDATVTETETETSSNWKSCGSRDFTKQLTELSFEDQRAEWGKAIVDARRLPRTAQFSNNHIMVNMERTKRTIPAVKRCTDLDAVARWHAEAMALEGKVRHSDPKELQAHQLLSSSDNQGEHLGENVGVGESIRAIHHEMMENLGDSRNMTDRRYKVMGMATARGANGKLYMCQIFSG